MKEKITIKNVELKKLDANEVFVINKDGQVMRYHISHDGWDTILY